MNATEHKKNGLPDWLAKYNEEVKSGKRKHPGRSKVRLSWISANPHPSVSGETLMHVHVTLDKSDDSITLHHYPSKRKLSTIKIGIGELFKIMQQRAIDEHIKKGELGI